MIVEDQDMSDRFFAFDDGSRRDQEDSLLFQRCGIRQRVGSNYHHSFSQAFEDRNFTKISFGTLSGYIPEILERFQVVDDVCHGSAYALATTQRGQVRDFFASADGQSKEAFTYPCLLNLHIVRHVLDQFVNCRLVVLAGCEPRDV